MLVSGNGGYLRGEAGSVHSLLAGKSHHNCDESNISVSSPALSKLILLKHVHFIVIVDFIQSPILQ